MTVVYPLTVQPDYTELKYSLRSIEKYLPPPFDVVIVGDRLPDWITGVTHIELPDIHGKKQLSIRSKILAALEYSPEILFMNDDVYLLKEQEFPYYWHGSLKHYSEGGSRPLAKELAAQKKPLKHFDGHYPLIYGQEFKQASENFSGECIIKSMYCNYLEIEGVFIADCKLQKDTKAPEIREFIKDKPCLSTGAYSIKSALPVLQELYGNKSIFET